MVIIIHYILRLHVGHYSVHVLAPVVYVFWCLRCTSFLEKLLYGLLIVLRFGATVLPNGIIIYMNTLR